MLTQLALVIFSTALLNNFVLAKFLGLCPVMGVSKKLNSALGMSLATAFVLTLTAGLSYLLFKYVLVPFKLEYLQIIVFIVSIAATVQFSEIFIRKASPLLHERLGLYLPLIASNCAILGLALLVTQSQTSFVHSLFYGLGTAIGFGLVLILFAAIRERLNTADIPKPFQGSAIAMITVGIMALGFMGFQGMM